MTRETVAKALDRHGCLVASRAAFIDDVGVFHSDDESGDENHVRFVLVCGGKLTAEQAETPSCLQVSSKVMDGRRDVGRCERCSAR